MIHPCAGGKKHWLLIVDEVSADIHSFFLKRESDLVETMKIWIKTLFVIYHIRIKKIRLDNSGENRMLQAKINQQLEDEKEIQPLEQQRRLGLVIDMIGPREVNLGSARSQTLEMRSPSNQE